MRNCPLWDSRSSSTSARSDHHHDVPMLNKTLTSFLSCRSCRSFPKKYVFALSITMAWNTSRFALRLPVLVSHGAYAWSRSSASMYFTTSDQACPLMLLNLMSLMRHGFDTVPHRGPRQENIQRWREARAMGDP